LTACIPPFLLTFAGPFYIKGTQAEQLKKRNDFAKLIVTVFSFCCRVCLFCCFWIKIDLDGLEDIRRNYGSTGRPLCVIANHTSFLDIILCVTVLPLHKVGKTKMIVSSHVLKMPIIGRLCKAMGHLAVPFKDTGKNSTTFEVDKEGMVKVMEQYEAHLASGESCAWYPEGQVHRGECTNLQQFRAGGLVIAVRNDVELWSMAMVGNAMCWPGNEAIGGYPADIGGKIECICKSSKEFFASEERGADERAKSVYLANYTQERMQKIIDDYVAKGYKAGDNTSKKKKIEKIEASKPNGGDKQD